MRRREFITLLGGTAAMWPLAASAQQADQVRRIGVLSNIGESDLEAQSMVTALHEVLRKLGWIAGDNLPPWKARLLLSLALTKTRDPDEIQLIFETH